jgi:beta-phosphoglucomutase family hydrolase
MTRPLKGLLFDMDGTIVDNMPHHLAAWKELLGKRGCAIDVDDFFVQTSGRHSREILRDYLDRALSDDECRALDDEKNAIYQRRYAPDLAPIAGLEAFIAHARELGLSIGLCTAAAVGNVRFVLDGLGLRHCFDTVVDAAAVPRGKPAPDVFLAAAERFGIDPAHCLVFEDAPLGVQAAENAGMPAVAITTLLSPADFSSCSNVIATAHDYRGKALYELIGSRRL